MEGAAGDFARALADELLDPLKHLLRRPPRKREQQYRAGRNAALDKPRDAINQRARLTRPGTGDDQQWAVAMRHGGKLRGIQDLGVLNPEVRLVDRLRGRPRVLYEDYPVRHCLDLIPPRSFHQIPRWQKSAPSVEWERGSPPVRMCRQSDASVCVHEQGHRLVMEW